MKSKPILNQIGTTFIPVSDIEKARDWYCDILALPLFYKITPLENIVYL